MVRKKDAYLRDGFIHLPGFFPTAEIAGIVEQIHNVLSLAAAEKCLPLSRQPDGRLSDSTLFAMFDNHRDSYIASLRAIQNLPSLFKLGTGERLLGTLQELGLKIPAFSSRPIVTLSSRRTSQHFGHWKTPAHQDWRSIQGSLNGIVAWCPMFDVDIELGRLEVVPGSHHLGLLDVEPDEWYMHIRADLEKEFEFVPLNTRAGDLVLFSMFIVHRSGTNRKEGHRYAIQYRYSDLSESTYIARGFPTAYKADAPTQTLITPGFGTALDLLPIFGESLPKPHPKAGRSR